MKLIVYDRDDFVFSLLTKNSELMELKIENLTEPEYASAIFLGKVKSIVSGVEGYFVDIGFKKDGYLPFSKSDKNYKVGDYVIVQIKKEPSRFKGAKLTTKLSFKGKYLIYIKQNNCVKTSHLFRHELKDYYIKEISKLLEPNEAIILRTQAENASIEDILSEIIFFRNKLKHLSDISHKSIMMLEKKEPHYLSIIKDYFSNIEKIVVTDSNIYKEIISFVIEQNLSIEVELSLDKQRLENFFEIDKYIKRLASKYVWLESGGFLVIEETEAMVTIDVNSGKNTCDCIESSSFSTNIEAALEIPKQIKLRNLGGIIMIDFIFMKDQEHRKKVLEILKEGFSKDNIQTTVYGYTTLGLVEIARKKTGKSIYEILKVPEEKTASVF